MATKKRDRFSKSHLHHPRLFCILAFVTVLYTAFAGAEKVSDNGGSDPDVRKDTTTNVETDGDYRKTSTKSNWTDTDGKKKWTEGWEWSDWKKTGGKGKDMHKYKNIVPEGTILDVVYLVDRSSDKMIKKAAKVVELSTEIAGECPGSRFGVSYYSDFKCSERNSPSFCMEAVANGLEHENGEGCYQFGKGLDPFEGLVPSAVEKLSPLVTSGDKQSALAAMLLTTADHKMDWFEGQKRVKVIFLISDAGTTCCTKEFGKKGPVNGMCNTIDNPSQETVGKLMRNKGVGLFLALADREGDIFHLWKETMTKLKFTYGNANIDKDGKWTVLKKFFSYVGKYIKWNEEYQGKKKTEKKITNVPGVKKKVIKKKKVEITVKKLTEKLVEMATSMEVSLEKESGEWDSKKKRKEKTGRDRGEVEVTTEKYVETTPEDEVAPEERERGTTEPTSDTESEDSDEWEEVPRKRKRKVKRRPFKCGCPPPISCPLPCTPVAVPALTEPCCPTAQKRPPTSKNKMAGEYFKATAKRRAAASKRLKGAVTRPRIPVKDRSIKSSKPPVQDNSQTSSKAAPKKKKLQLWKRMGKTAPPKSEN